MTPLFAVAWFIPLLTWLAAAFIKVATNTFAAIQQAFYWMWALMYSVLLYVWSTIPAASGWPIEEQFLGMWSYVSPYLYYANYWVPLYEAVSMFVAYCAFWTAFIPIKAVIRHLPFIGR